MQMSPRFTLARLSSLAVAALFVAAPAASLRAQTALPAATPESGHTSLNLDLQAALRAPLDLAPAASSSSASDAAAADRLNLEADPGDGNLQPPPRRRRYGRPNYNDRWHNADGSNRLGFLAGGGFNVPVGDATANYLSTSWRFEVGGGINFSQKLSVMAQFDYDHFGIPGSILRNQQTLYNNLGFVDGNNNRVDFTGLGGNAHIWSFTLNPTFNVHQGEKLGAYVVAGGGFYHKVSNFTLPQVAQGFSYYYGSYQYVVNQNVDSYTSNAPGVTGGVGLTYRLSRFSNQRLFAEARYVHTFNQYRAGDQNYTGAGTPYNLYPPNSNESSYIPITFGIRF